ncbi:MAG: TonB family protein [Deltaproteobacteria bacterium]|nr:TonB family protein [Deltaproteobacteria bacterium]
MKSVLILVALGACATTGTSTLDREPHSTGSRVHLDLAVHADAQRLFPAAIDPRLPSADRLAPQILAELGNRASIEVKLCVAPEGRVSSVEVLKSSTLTAFDQSVMADAMSWQFSALPGPANVRTCERATITYLPHG